MKYEIGRTVRFIIADWATMTRTDYYAMGEYYLLDQSTEGLDHVVLGGEYRIDDSRTNQYGRDEYKIMSEWLPYEWIIPSEKVQLCPFAVGEGVVINIENSCEGELNDYIGEVHPNWLNPSTKLAVTNIVNKYYIQLAGDSAFYQWHYFKTSST